MGISIIIENQCITAARNTELFQVLQNKIPIVSCTEAHCQQTLIWLCLSYAHTLVCSSNYLRSVVSPCNHMRAVFPGSNTEIPLLTNRVLTLAISLKIDIFYSNILKNARQINQSILPYLYFISQQVVSHLYGKLFFCLQAETAVSVAMNPSVESSNNFLSSFLHLPICTGFIGKVRFTGIGLVTVSSFLNKDAVLPCLGTVFFLVKDLFKQLDWRGGEQSYVFDFISIVFPGKGSMFPFSHNAGVSSYLKINK